MTEENQLVAVIKQNNLPTEQMDSLMAKFAGFYSTARQIVEESKDIVVTSETQTDKMALAKTARGKLRDIRIEVEKTRVALKEQSLRTGKAIDGVANVIKALIIPIEENLERQEKFAEIKKAEMIANRYAERVEKLSKYVTDISLYSLKDMPDEVFDNLLAGCKANFEKAQQEQKEAEEKQRIETAKQNTFRQRQIELAPYTLFVKQAITADTTVDEFNKIFKQAVADKKAADEANEKIKKENEALKKQQEEAAAKAAADKAAKEKAEREAAEKLAAEKKAEEEAKAKAEKAPDKEKLKAFANQLENLEYPILASKEATELLLSIKKTIVQIQLKCNTF